MLHAGACPPCHDLALDLSFALLSPSSFVPIVKYFLLFPCSTSSESFCKPMLCEFLHLLRHCDVVLCGMGAVSDEHNFRFMRPVPDPFQEPLAPCPYVHFFGGGFSVSLFTLSTNAWPFTHIACWFRWGLAHLITLLWWTLVDIHRPR